MDNYEDIQRWHLWTASVRKIKPQDKGPLSIGTKALVYQPKLPPALWRVPALEPERGFTWVSSGPGILVTAEHHIEPVPERSEVRLSIKFDGLIALLFYRLI